jgi:hypothetical protein
MGVTVRFSCNRPIFLPSTVHPFEEGEDGFTVGVLAAVEPFGEAGGTILRAFWVKVAGKAGTEAALSVKDSGKACHEGIGAGFGFLHGAKPSGKARWCKWKIPDRIAPAPRA